MNDKTNPRTLAIANMLAKNDQYDFENVICVPHKAWVGPFGAPNNLIGLGGHYYAFGPAMRVDAPFVHVVIDGDIMISVRTRTEERLVAFLNTLCSVCSLTKLSCSCDKFSVRPQGKWSFSSGTSEQYSREYFYKYWTANHQIFADWDWEPDSTPQLQGFESILAEPSTTDDVLKILEDVATFIYYLRSAFTVEDYAVAFATLVRSVTGRSVTYLNFKFMKYIINELAYDILGIKLQSGETHFELLWNNYKMLQTSPAAKMIMKLLSHSIMGVVLMKVGVEPDSERVRNLYEGKIKPTLTEYSSLLDCLGNIIVFTLKQGRQYMLTGDLNCFFINGDSVTEWIEKAKSLKANFEFLSNPDAVKINIFDYLKDLREAIDNGNSMCKTLKSSTTEYKIVSNLNLELTTLEKRYICLNAALSMRMQPLGIVLYGKPGIGKSFITDKIAKMYAEIHELNPSPAYRFYHCSEDDYFTNFKSFMHTIVLDDVAQHTPDRVQGVDASLSTLIKIFNNQPFSPPQAAIDDKGKTPLLCELGIVTTNVRDMNIPKYFSSSYAVMRRFPVHIEPILKPDYVTKDGALDTNAIDGVEEIWDFKISKPKMLNSNKTEGVQDTIDYMRGGFFEECTLTSLRQLREYLEPIMIEHRRRQMQVLCRKDDLCVDCLCSKMNCMCQRLQGDVTELEEKDEESLFRNNFRRCAVCNLQHDEGYCTVKKRKARKKCVNCCNFPEACHCCLNCMNARGECKCPPSCPKCGSDGECNCELDKTEEKPSSLFDFEYPDQHCPWRLDNEKVFGTSRFFNMKMAKNFEKNMCSIYRTERDIEWVRDYTYMFLPDLMRRGYDDIMIREDFCRYHVHRMNERDKRTEYENLNKDNNFTGWRYYVWSAFTYMYYEWSIVRYIFLYLMEYSLMRKLLFDLHEILLRGSQRRRSYMKKMGNSIDKSLFGSESITKIVAVMSAGWVVFQLNLLFQNSVFKKPKERNLFRGKKSEKTRRRDEFIDRMIKKQEDKLENYKKFRAAVWEEMPDDQVEDIVGDEDLDQPFVQNTLAFYNKESVPTTVKLEEFGSDPKPACRDAVQNVWEKPERVVTTVDFHDKRATTLEACMRSVQNSCVLVDIIYQNSTGSTIKYTGRAIIIDSDTIMINNHAVPKFSFHLTVYMFTKQQPSPIIHIFIDPQQVSRIECRDIAFITTKALPQLYNNIHRQFAKASFRGEYDGFYLIVNEEGLYEQLPVRRIKRAFIDMNVSGFDMKMDCYVGTPDRPTVQGECGAPLFMNTGYGPIIVGYHFMFVESAVKSYATMVTLEDLVEHSKCDYQVQCTYIEIPFPLIEADISYCDFHKEGSLMYHGEVRLNRIRGKSRVCKTEIADQILRSADFEDFHFEDDFSAPTMHRWKPQQKALTEYMKPAYGINEVYVAKCAEVLLLDILAHLPKSELELIAPVNVGVAINGKPGMAYVDGIKRGTSMGWPFHTTKRKYLEKLDDARWPDGVVFCKEVMDRIQKVLDLYCAGKRAHPVFSANLKDEVVSIKKRKNDKTRVFFSCPTEFLVIVRMIFLGFTRVVQRNWKVFHCVIGINCFSVQWHELYIELTKFGQDHMIAGDFAGFDKKFSIAFQRWAFWVITQICIRSGNFEEYHINIMRCIEADLVNPTVNWFGMIITLLGGEVSGHQLTTVFNCFCCVLYIMYCYAHVYNINSFFKNVVIFSLGDDHVIGVSEHALEFNHTKIQEILEIAGVGYTMAEKEKESVPFIHMNEVTFLKRRFVYSTYLGKVIAPLEARSIIKMLTYHVRSKNVSEAEQVAEAMVSASMESFFHGRDSFEYIDGILNSLELSESLKLYVLDSPRPSWEENVNRYWAASSHYLYKVSPAEDNKEANNCVLNGHITEIRSQKAYVTGLSQKKPLHGSYCQPALSQLAASWRMDHAMKLTRAFPEIRIDGLVRLVPETIDKGECIESRTYLENHGLASKTNSQIIGNDLPSSAEVPVASSETTEEQTYFIDKDQSTEVDLSTSHDPIADSMVLIPDLSSYLSRPAKIWSYTWNLGVGSGLLTSFRPWDAFFTITSIQRKLENFRYIRCNLNLKFVINASPFYYGSLGAFYQPLQNDTGDKIGLPTGYIAGQQISVSQRNHVWLNPQSVTSAEMKLPFLHYRNFCDLNARSAVQNMGEIGIWEFATLQSANGVSTGGVTINCYAWASEVELAGASSAPILQGKKEYIAGPVSGPASTVKNIAGRLKDVPVIGPFAAATEVVSGAIGDVARYFGYTNVPITDDVKPMKPLAFHTLASSQISEPINKLSLQPDAETSVGAYHGDIMADPLVIKDFVARESFLCGTAWTTANAEDDILFTCAVTPELFDYGGTGNQKAIFNTPMAYAANFFQYWNGDIKFKFRIIKSQYHRGRLNICWDAGINAAANMPTVGSPAVFNVIVDLDEEDEVEVVVPYTQSAPFLKTTTSYTTPTRCWENGGSPTFTYAGNGTIQVRVLNALTAPVSTSSVVIQMFVSGAPNLQFGGPKNLYQYSSLFQLQGKTIEFNGSSIDNQCFKEMFGENIVSFRELLHRQTKSATLTVPKDMDFSAWTGDYQDVSFPINRVPRPFGYSPSGWSTAANVVAGSGSSPFNYTRNHPLIQMIACFVGYKGSVNWTFNCRYVGDASNRAAVHMSICRKTDRINYVPIGSTFSNSQSKSTVAYHCNDEGWMIDSSGAAGVAITNQLTQAGLSANLPYYNNYKFQVSNLNNLYAANNTGYGVENDYYNLHVFRKITSGSPDNDVTIDAYCGTGPDFDFIYFLNCPPLYWRANSPDPV